MKKFIDGGNFLNFGHHDELEMNKNKKVHLYSKRKHTICEGDYHSKTIQVRNTLKAVQVWERRGEVRQSNVKIN